MTFGDIGEDGLVGATSWNARKVRHYGHDSYRLSLVNLQSVEILQVVVLLRRAAPTEQARIPDRTGCGTRCIRQKAEKQSRLGVGGGDEGKGNRYTRATDLHTSTTSQDFQPMQGFNPDGGPVCGRLTPARDNQAASLGNAASPSETCWTLYRMRWRRRRQIERASLARMQCKLSCLTNGLRSSS